MKFHNHRYGLDGRCIHYDGTRRCPTRQPRPQQPAPAWAVRANGFGALMCLACIVSDLASFWAAPNLATTLRGAALVLLCAGLFLIGYAYGRRPH